MRGQQGIFRLAFYGVPVFWSACLSSLPGRCGAPPGPPGTCVVPCTVSLASPAVAAALQRGAGRGGGQRLRPGPHLVWPQAGSMLRAAARALARLDPWPLLTSYFHTKQRRPPKRAEAAPQSRQTRTLALSFCKESLGEGGWGLGGARCISLFSLGFPAPQTERAAV